MAGNSSRRGAVRGSKKGATTGSGGNNKKRMSAKGPTPKAEDRPYHAAAKRKAAATKKGAPRRPSQKPVRPKGGGELVAGRNAVVEALRAGVPSTELIVARGVDIDDRITESLKLALDLHLPIREVHRAEIEGLSGSSQGILLA
ncbi:MAG: 23S rRNA (guanosine(2251)-2'-O)-methyltransferase RlmB, partial [Actinobacteria bacterium]|nr:23S rRNA (guanosine(2251)-2'-O)-methyltransferase RlmB [Actinomycetota bacterium]